MMMCLGPLIGFGKSSEKESVDMCERRIELVGSMIICIRVSSWGVENPEVNPPREVCQLPLS